MPEQPQWWYPPLPAFLRFAASEEKAYPARRGNHNEKPPGRGHGLAVLSTGNGVTAGLSVH